eukprot:m.10464 g.10464  ORF g.10464 m.10464 type:complete len:182 (-) comp5570_c0_seq1:158-703(-)
MNLNQPLQDQAMAEAAPQQVHQGAKGALNQRFPMRSWHSLRGHGENVACLKQGAFVLSSKGVRGHLMLCEEFRDYSGSTGFSYVLKPDAFEVELARVYMIDRVMVWTWDQDDRVYTLKIEVAEVFGDWLTVFEGDQPNSNGGFNYPLPDGEKPVRYIRLSGYNTKNAGLHVLKLAAYHTLS